MRQKFLHCLQFLTLFSTVDRVSRPLAVPPISLGDEIKLIGQWGIIDSFSHQLALLHPPTCHSLYPGQQRIDNPLLSQSPVLPITILQLQMYSLNCVVLVSLAGPAECSVVGVPGLGFAVVPLGWVQGGVSSLSGH